MAKIFTKRNAMIGWTAWKVGKGIAKKKAQGAVHVKKSKSSKKKKAGKILAGVGAAVGVTALLKRKRKHKHGDTPSASGE